MSPSDRPTAVRSYVLRPLWWLPAATAVGVLMYVAGATAARTEDESFDEGYGLEATVDEDYGGGAEVPLSYDNPLTGETQAKAYRWGDDPAPAPGERVAIEVDRKDPRDVVLAGQRYPGDEPWYVSIPAVIVLAVFGARLFGVWRTGRLITGPGPSFTMLGAVGPASWGSHRPLLHLYPIDAKPGASPLCSVGLHSSGGIPVGGAAFVAEVKGRPRPFGRVAVRVGDAVLWPRGRSLSAATSASLPPRTSDPPRFQEAAPISATIDAATIQRSLVPLGGVAAALCLGVVVTGMSLRGRIDAEQLEQDGVEVVATVTDSDADDFSVGAEFRLPGREEVVEAQVPVDVPEDWDVDDRFPAVVDPSDPQRVRFLDEPYDALEPILWGWTPAVLALCWLVWSSHWRRLERKVTAGPWFEVDTWWTEQRYSPLVAAQVVDVAVAHPDSSTPSCVVRIPVERSGWWPVRRFRPSVRRMAASGRLSPGEPVALRHDGVVVPGIGPARSQGASRRVG